MFIFKVCLPNAELLEGFDGSGDIVSRSAYHKDCFVRGMNEICFIFMGNTSFLAYVTSVDIPARVINCAVASAKVRSPKKLVKFFV